ncbi:hypothetical protein ABER23_18380 [Paenibacillus lautus]
MHNHSTSAAPYTASVHLAKPAISHCGQGLTTLFFEAASVISSGYKAA